MNARPLDVYRMGRNVLYRNNGGREIVFDVRSSTCAIPRRPRAAKTVRRRDAKTIVSFVPYNAQSFFSTEQPSVKSVSSTAAAEQKIAADVTTAAVPSLSQDESATPQQASSSVAKNEEEEKVTDEPSVAATPAADPQPAQQEEVAATTAAAAAADADVATNDEAPAAEQQQQQSSGETTEVGELGGTVAADAETPVDATKEPAADPVVVVEPVQGTSDGAADNDGPASETPAVDGGSDSTPVADRKSEQVTVPGNKNDASAPGKKYVLVSRGALPVRSHRATFANKPPRERVRPARRKRSGRPGRVARSMTRGVRPGNNANARRQRGQCTVFRVVIVRPNVLYRTRRECF